MDHNRLTTQVRYLSSQSELKQYCIIVMHLIIIYKCYTHQIVQQKIARNVMLMSIKDVHYMRCNTYTIYNKKSAKKGAKMVS